MRCKGSFAARTSRGRGWDRTPPEIVLTRRLQASPDQVFRAWIDPQLMKQWLAPDPCEVREAVVDARPGGRYSIVVVDPDGNVHTTTGEYRELVPGKRLVKTWAYEGPFAFERTASLVTVDLRELGPGVTELTLTHGQIVDEAGRAGAGAGWVLCLDKLAKLVMTSTDGGTG
jgi:uncharacterized protein YndB with AHSA1/START domain